MGIVKYSNDRKFNIGQALRDGWSLDWKGEEALNGFACFWYKDGKWVFSLYNDNREVDCSLIAKQYGGGGHFSASGFVVDNIGTFLNYG